MSFSEPESKEKLAGQIKHILDVVLTLPGKKILVLLVADQEEPFVVDVSEKGKIGYESHHEALLKTRLFVALRSFGSLVVRQFLHMKVEMEIHNKKQWIPLKKVYGIALGNSQYTTLSIAEMKKAYSFDYETGKPLPPELDIVFGELNL
ncbi:MAG: hypothetical protein AABZ60_23475 [Planctomycetota bacterium]